MNGQRGAPCSYEFVLWKELTQGVRVFGRLFSNGVWGIVAETSAGEMLVVFDEVEQCAGFQTFYAAREQVEGVLDFLEILLDPDLPAPDPQVEERLKSVTAIPPFVPGSFGEETSFGEREHFEDLVVALDKVAEKDCQKVLALEQEWRRRVAQGNRQSCLCSQCRHEVRYQLDQILDWYDKAPGYAPFNLEKAANRLLVLLAK